MATVIIDLSVSLDGYIAGANDGPGNPLGDGGPAVFDWMADGPGKTCIDPRVCVPEASLPVVQEWQARAGAFLTGRRTFDIAGGWADGHPVDAPIFVVTHEPPTEGRWNPDLEFVTEGPEVALERAREVAGDGVISIGGASVGQQLLRAGLVDEIQVHVTPVILNGGVRMLDHLGTDPITLEQIRVVPSDGVTHLRYRVVRS